MTSLDDISRYKLRGKSSTVIPNQRLLKIQWGIIFTLLPQGQISHMSLLCTQSTLCEVAVEHMWKIEENKKAFYPTETGFIYGPI